MLAVLPERPQPRAEMWTRSRVAHPAAV